MEVLLLRERHLRIIRLESLSMWNRSSAWFIALVVAVVACGTANARGWKLGDRAPSLKISNWVKGGPIDPAKGIGKNTYLIEFWATWCPPCIESIPHLTELQRKYKKDGLVVIGIAGPGRGETLRKVERFVTKRGSAMDYAVAYDGSSATSERFMGGAGVGGIPWACLIDKEGKIMWHGHPGNPIMDEIIDQVVKGTYDASSAIVQEKLAPLFGRLNQMHMARNWGEFKSTAKSILEMDPGNETAFAAMVYVYLFETDDAEGLRDFVEEHIRKHKNDPVAMNALAQSLLGMGELDKRQPDLALRAATAAYEACRGGDCSMVDTYARAMFEIGLVDRAIELQAQAVTLAKGEQRAALEKVAEFYKKCKALQSRNAAGG